MDYKGEKMETKKPILRQEIMTPWTTAAVVGTERSSCILGIIRTFDRTDVDSDWKGKTKVTATFLSLNKWKDESAFNEGIKTVPKRRELTRDLFCT